MKSDLTIQQKKEWAFLLYTAADHTQKDIALKVGVSEKTIGKWIHADAWDKKRKSLLTTKPEQLRFLYDQLDALNKYIREKDSEKFANSKEADSILKLTAAIKNLEIETSVGEIVEIASQFIRFIQAENLEQAKAVAIFFDAFIKERLKTF